MATLTINIEDEALIERFRREAATRGITPEAVVLDRLAASTEADRLTEREAWGERLLARLNAGESVDGPLGEELCRWRDSSNLNISGDSIKAMIREMRDGDE